MVPSTPTINGQYDRFDLVSSAFYNPIAREVGVDLVADGVEGILRAVLYGAPLAVSGDIVIGGG